MRRALLGPTGRTVLTLVVVGAIFAGVLPAIADYGEVWGLLRELTELETALVLALAIVSLFAYAPLWIAAMPGLTVGRAVLADTASTAVSNTVPAGFAVGVGVNAAMYHSFGFSPAAITRAVVLTGIWENLVKLAMPAGALAGVALVGDVPATAFLIALTGSVVLFAAVAALVLLLVSRSAAAWLARAGERIAGRAAQLARRDRPTGWVPRADRFRAESLSLVRARWPQMTVAAVGNTAALFLVLLACLRAVGGPGADVHWVQVLAVFSLTRLITMVPVTPGAVGVAELSYVAGLSTIGVGTAAATAAVLLFRFLTWFLPVPVGAVSWLVWQRGAGRAPAPDRARPPVDDTGTTSRTSSA